MTVLRILSRASTPILGALLVLSALFGFARANDVPFRWAVYYGADAPSEAFAEYRMVVFDSDRHPDIEPIAARRTQVLGYLSIGEVHRTRSYFAEVEREGLLVYENPTWPGAFAVDVRDTRWRKRIVDELVPAILARGFQGVFLDTADTAIDLERRDRAKFAGATLATIELIKAIRNRHPQIAIVLNRGYEILPAVEGAIDMVLAEIARHRVGFPEQEAPHGACRRTSSTGRPACRCASAHAQAARTGARILDAGRRPEDQGDLRAGPRARLRALCRDGGPRSRGAGTAMKRFAILFLCLAGLLAPTRVDAQVQSRRVFVLWDSSVTTRWRETFAHLMLEMPLNRLGYVVEPVDVAKPMPSASAFEGAHAVVSWLEADTVPDARAAFGFIEAATARGLRFVQLGDAAFLRGRDGAPSVSIAEGNRVFARAGFRLVDDFVRLTFDVEVLRKESALVEYERPLDRVLPPYPVWRPLDARTRSLLVLRRRGQPDTESHVVMLAPGGGLASFGYSHFFEPELRRRQWRIDPFEFLAAALGAGGGPVPDVTTLVGRRIFFSHVDGDGWRNVTEIVPWRRSRKLSSEVILDEVLKRYPDLPVTIGPVVADLHPEWCGSDETRAIARQMFALQHVEAGSHTWTHPLDWGFFDVPDTAAKERPFLRRYPGCRSEPSRLVAVYERIMRRLAGAAGDGDDGSEFDGQYGTIGSYNTPRSFAKKPFDIDFEIADAAAYIATLAPAGKTVPVVQWSGNTMPFEAVLRATRVARAAQHQWRRHAL